MKKSYNFLILMLFVSTCTSTMLLSSHRKHEDPKHLQQLTSCQKIRADVLAKTHNQKAATLAYKKAYRKTDKSIQAEKAYKAKYAAMHPRSAQSKKNPIVMNQPDCATDLLVIDSSFEDTDSDDNEFKSLCAQITAIPVYAQNITK